MSQSTNPTTPGVPATTSSVWPPSNPSGTVIPFPLPWGQTGCCPPGGMDALMKCYCDIQAASAFIGQIMIDQINNNPAVTAAIIAAIEKSGSSLPLTGVTNGQAAQPGQVGELVYIPLEITVPSGANNQQVSLGVLQPGDWTCQASTEFGLALDSCDIGLIGPPAGTTGFGNQSFGTMAAEQVMITPDFAINTSVPVLIAFTIGTVNPGAAGQMIISLFAQRAR